MKKRNPLKLTFKGVEWTLHMQSDAAYSKMHGKDSDACTYPGDKEAWFARSSMIPSIVRHELLHIYVSSSGINSASLDKDQMEELCAELFEEHGPEMMLNVDKIIDYFLR
jgi:hypothetical protein